MTELLKDQEDKVIYSDDKFVIRMVYNRSGELSIYVNAVEAGREIPPKGYVLGVNSLYTGHY